MKTVKPFAEQGHYVEAHNLLFDYMMPRISANSFKILCYVLRRTKGWSKKSDEIPYSQIKEGTGIKSDTTVSKSLFELLEAGYILRKEPDHKFGTVRYALNLKFEIPTSEIEVRTPENGVTDEHLPSPENGATRTPENGVKPTPENGDTKNNYESTNQSTTPNGVGAEAPPSSKNNSEKQPSSKPESLPVDNPVFVALREALKMDWAARALTVGQRKNVTDFARILIADGVTPEKVRNFPQWWAACDWRGKKGERPKLSTMREEWPRYLEESQNGNMPRNGRPLQTTDEEIRALTAKLVAEQNNSQGAAR